MNKAQRRVLVAGLLVAVAMVVYPPWVCKGVQSYFTPEQKAKYDELAAAQSQNDVGLYSRAMDRYKPAPVFREIARLPDVAERPPDVLFPRHAAVLVPLHGRYKNILLQVVRRCFLV